ncbi:Dynactin [Operophtera brumata]|uniref:Dynactin n=1 Tax=Operophtera brumata TaxID=104452 RepID=A0A0L7LNW9_OPEBR|nr:Dynactin [Operophtera brumata]
MAEERAEALQMELENCREKLEESTLDLQLMRAEMEAGGNIQHPYSASEGATGYEMRQMQQQNARMRDTLLSRTKEKLSSRVEELEAQVADLREQVDAALGAEEMTIMDRDSTINKFRELVHKMTESYNELKAQADSKVGPREGGCVETIVDRDSTINKFRELVHKMTESYNELKAQADSKEGGCVETIMDRDSTINKFRELVHIMTESYNELKAQADSKGTFSREPRVTGAAELGSLVAASRACTRSVDLQLRALELTQARARADMLAACLPEHFMHTAAMRYVSMWSTALDTCSPDLLVRCASALPDALQQPSDRTQELGQLHESISTSSSALQQQLKGIRRRLPPGALLSAVPLDPQVPSNI